MNSYEIEAVLTVYKEKSFTRAADIMHVSQPSLSRTIANIEHTIGGKIFDRSLSPIGLTELGKNYIDTACRINNLLFEFDTKCHDMLKVKTGTIRLGITRSRAHYYLPVLIPGFLKKFPYVDFKLQENNTSGLLLQLKEGSIDFAIFTLWGKDPDLVYRPISIEQLYLCTPPGYLPVPKGQSFTEVLPQLREKCLPLVTLHKGQRLRKITSEILRDYRLDSKMVLEVGAVEIAERICAQQIGVTFAGDLPKKVLENELSLDYYRLPERYHLPVVIAYRKGFFLSALYHEFLEHIAASRDRL
jgi:DNA-binding transcriptional LysR family regulator